MADMKESDKELELARKGAEALRAAFGVNEKLEKRIVELEMIIKLHSDELKHAADCLESNANIIKMMMDEKINELDGRFRRHVNNTDVHVSVQ